MSHVRTSVSLNNTHNVMSVACLHYLGHTLGRDGPSCPKFLRHIQGVTGGTDQSSGECSLGHTIPI